MSKKIAFFDIDGTLTSEKDGSIPDSAVIAIREARANGNLMFINTGRTYSNVESRFKDIGFDGIVSGCGTNIFYHGEELMHVEQSREITKIIIDCARKLNADIIYEAKTEVVFDLYKPIKAPAARRLYYEYREKHYDMSHNPESEDFVLDKFCVWFASEKDIPEFCEVSDRYFTCIDRGGLFREFVPNGYSKATGIQFLVDHFGLKLSDAYAFGDSNNDLPMLMYVPHSVAMGNAEPDDLKNLVSYVTDKASEDGIANALHVLGF
jgi:hypothetical protein